MTPGPPASTLFPYTTLFRSLLAVRERQERVVLPVQDGGRDLELLRPRAEIGGEQRVEAGLGHVGRGSSRSDRKSTRLNSSHGYISYAVFCLKKKKKKQEREE